MFTVEKRTKITVITEHEALEPSVKVIKIAIMILKRRVLIKELGMVVKIPTIAPDVIKTVPVYSIKEYYFFQIGKNVFFMYDFSTRVSFFNSPK